MSTEPGPAFPVGDGGPVPLPASVRVRLDLAYDGTDFSGWATQPGCRTVQATVEGALVRFLRLPSVQLTVAGRTDAGVHATGQVAHLDLPAAVWDEHRDRMLRRLAGLLPSDVRVTAVRAAPPGFDARFAALSRSYEYRISDAPSGADPLRRHVTLAWPRPLDAAAMATAAAGLLGLHDFAAFCRRSETGTSVRTLERLDILRTGTDLRIAVRADAFCHSMVRSMVGALLAVGEGRRPVDWPAALLTRRVRADDVSVAPAHGLTLVEVRYPPDAELGRRVLVTRAVRPPLPDGP